ncbi:MAG: hypothetical protein NTU49_08205 [Gammaproteobacteria bacterium]|nr:hypothetical protein [Gammaproteobacteria bacterium]
MSRITSAQRNFVLFNALDTAADNLHVEAQRLAIIKLRLKNETDISDKRIKVAEADLDKKNRENAELRKELESAKQIIDGLRRKERIHSASKTPAPVSQQFFSLPPRLIRLPSVSGAQVPRLTLSKTPDTTQSKNPLPRFLQVRKPEAQPLPQAPVIKPRWK